MEPLESRPAHGDDAPHRDPRDSLFVLAGIRCAGDDTFDRVRVRNVSSGGLMVETHEPFAAGSRIELSLETLGVVAGSVAWAEAGRIGVAFDHPIDKQMARKPIGDGRAGIDRQRPHPTDFRRPPLRAR